MIYRYFQTIEAELLLQSYTFFTSNQLNMMRRRLELEQNPVRKNFANYLQAIIFVYQADYVQANEQFAKLGLTMLPRQSMYFARIYHTLSEFLVNGGQFHLQLENLKQTLPDEYYAYLLIKAVGLFHQNRVHRPRSFYLRLQLATILPHLAPSLFVAHLYYELGQFYLFILPNAQVAQQCLLKTQKILHDYQDDAFTIMTQIALAEVASLRSNQSQALKMYEAIDWFDQKMTIIDPFHYYNAVLNAVRYFIANEHSYKLNQLLPILRQIETVKDPQKQVLLQFKGYCVKLELKLAKGVNELADYNPVIVAGSKLLKQVQNDRLAPFHQLQWLTLLAKIRLMCHEYQQALATLQVALELSLQEHDTGTQIKIHRLFSQGYAAIEDFENAIYHFEAADHLMIDLRKQQHKHTVLTLKANYQDKAFEVLLVDELYNHEQLQNQVVTDQLTQLGNRQALTKLEQVLRNQSRLNVAMLDIDYFKKYNDYYGHLAGDELLYQFAKLLHHVFPASHVIRYGGEEFTVIDSQMDETVFVGKLQQFQSALNQQAFAHEGVASMAIVTVSIGYVQMKEAMPLEKLIAQADTALYQAKNSGRNCLKGYA